MRCLMRTATIVIVVASFGIRPSLAGDFVRNSTTAVLQDHFESPAVGNAPDNGARSNKPHAPGAPGVPYGQ